MVSWLLLVCMLAVLGPAVTAAEPTVSLHAPSATAPWTADRVAQAAAERSPRARLLQAELAALNAATDRSDNKACAQLALAQKVTCEWICYEREQSAADAMTRYYEWLYLQEQRRLLQQAQQIIQDLLRLTDKADELEIKDGNRQSLELRQLELADRQAEAEGATAKLVLIIAEQVGEPEWGALWQAPSEMPERLPDRTQIEWVNMALELRCDLRAIEQLCHSLNADNLPFAKQMLATVQPGLGLIAAVALKKPLLALHDNDRAPAELRQRRDQCASLLASRQSQVRLEVALAHTDLQTNLKRLAVAQQVVDVRSQLVRQTRKAIELEQAKPGTDSLAELEQLEAQATAVQRQADVATSWVALRKATGTVLRASP